MVRLTHAFAPKVRVRVLTPCLSSAVPLGESIASEGKGEYMYVEGYVRDTSGTPIPGAVIDTWETDDKGEQDSNSVQVFPTLTLATRCARLQLFFSKVSTIPSTQIALSQTAAVGS